METMELKKRSSPTWALIGIAILASYLIYTRWERNHYLAILPPQIETDGTVLISTESGFREGCGAAIFELSESTLSGIAQHDLAFFQNARQARGHNNDSYYTYQEWKKTPVPRSWTSEGIWSGLGCVTGAKQLLHDIYDAGVTGGSYYTVKQEGELIVIPKLKIVVFSFFG